MEKVLRTDTGEIRFLWKLAATLILLIVFIIVSRVALIFVVQQIFILQGVPSSAAFQTAQTFVAESSEGQAIASSLDMILTVILVVVLVTRIEKHEFHLDAIGLNLQRNTLPLMALGFAIGWVLFLGAIMFGTLLNTIELPVLLTLDQWPFWTALVAAIIFYILNAFWQEIVFRGYLQTQAINEYGRTFGIVLIAVIFVVFHGLVQTLTPIGILSGLLLFGFIGLLYDKTKSLYLVGVIHAALNFLPVLFDIMWSGLETGLMYGIALLLLILVIYQTEQRRSLVPQ